MSFLNVVWELIVCAWACEWWSWIISPMIAWLRELACRYIFTLSYARVHSYSLCVRMYKTCLHAGTYSPCVPVRAWCTHMRTCLWRGEETYIVCPATDIQSDLMSECEWTHDDPGRARGVQKNGRAWYTNTNTNTNTNTKNWVCVCVWVLAAGQRPLGDPTKMKWLDWCCLHVSEPCQKVLEAWMTGHTGDQGRRTLLTNWRSVP